MATVEVVVDSVANIFYNHTDHLGSINVVTDASGAQVQLLDYFPFGSQRISSGTQGSQRQYIGEYFDVDTDLSYLNTRYYDGGRGRFVSEDPVFWEIGQTEDGKKILTNPQLQNSYSYAGNNPISYKDPDGRLIDTLADIGFIGYDIYKITQAVINGGNIKQEVKALGLDTAGAFIPFVTGAGSVYRATNKVDNLVSTANHLSDSVQVCRGGNCSIQSFMKGSSEARAGLNVSSNTPVSGISVNIGNSKDILIKNLPKGLNNEAGFSGAKQIQGLGGKLMPSPTKNNPFHAVINGLTPQQLNKVFKVEKIK